MGAGVAISERVLPVSSSVSLTSGVSGRYATALFEIARDAKKVDRVEADLTALEAALAESKDFRDVIASPIHTRAEQTAAMAALAKKMQLDPEVSSTIGLLAANRRLFVLPAMISDVKSLIADHRGEVTAQVTSASELSDDQRRALSETLRSSVGKDIKVDVTVDRSLIGGMVVKVGSRMIDTSIRSKLVNLQNVMKEVG